MSTSRVFIGDTSYIDTITNPDDYVAECALLDAAYTAPDWSVHIFGVGVLYVYPSGDRHYHLYLKNCPQALD